MSAVDGPLSHYGTFGYLYGSGVTPGRESEADGERQTPAALWLAMDLKLDLVREVAVLRTSATCTTTAI